MGEYLDSKIEAVRHLAEHELDKDPVYFEWVLRLLWQGDYDDALAKIHEAERLCSLSTAVTLRQAEREIIEKQYPEAVQLLCLEATR
jgi:hypothetical protein